MTPKHLTPFNPVEETAPATSFPQFGQLHKELRLHIWELILQQHERILHVSISDTHDSTGRPLGQDPTFTVRGRNVVPKLLVTCGDSRDAALNYYRVQIPCKHEWDGVTEDGMLYINPERDIIHLNPGRGDAFINFLHDARQSDPRGIGITNLAMYNNNINRLPPMSPEELGREKRISLAESIKNIRNLYFMSVERAGRMHTGPLNGIHYIRRWEMHRSRPIYCARPAFERRKRDPRDIDRDIKKVFLGTSDPRAMILTWRRLLASWGVTDHAEAIRYHFLLSCSPGGSNTLDIIHDRESAVAWLRQEDDKWLGMQRKYEQQITGRGGTVPVEGPEELERAPQPAIGFWLFPLEALGPVPEEATYHNQRPGALRAKRVVDMTEHWPELCLSVLP